jgi:hypothetical protein
MYHMVFYGSAIVISLLFVLINNKLILESHVILYVLCDWLKKLRLFSYVRNLKLDVVLKASRAVVIG